ncbi:MAG TPA: glycosyltransferase [Chthoniobacteraceae bacterium]
MKKVLILTAAYGEGHNAAARGLQAGFEQIGGVEAKVVDSFAESLGSAYDRSRKGYLKLIDRAPHVWAAVFSLLHYTPVIHLVVPTLSPVRKALARVLEAESPDAVVSTYPVYNYLLDRLPPRGFPQYTVVTDSITINSVWHRSRSDLFFVPNEDTARVMRDAKVPAEKLRVLGFPVPPRFAAPRAERSKPGRGQPLRVLFMINAAKDRAPALVQRLLEISGIELTVTAGRDEALQAAIRAVGEKAGRPVEVYGWTPQMPELLMSHHLLIGKAGGAAVQETIAARTPMIATQVVPGQEEGNARLLTENRCGAVCETSEAVAAMIEKLRAEDAREWREWETNITRLSRPDAAVKIAEAVLQELAASPARPKSDVHEMH